MEDIYAQRRFRALFTKKVDLQKFFCTYSEEINKYFKIKRRPDVLKALCGIEDDEEYDNIKRIMNPSRARSTHVPKSFVPKRRFLDTWALYDLPSFDVKLVTIQNIHKETREEKYKRMKAARYPGKVILEVEKESEDFRRVPHIDPLEDYLICVRILTTVGGCSKYHTPSQELWVPGELTLERIKDRIICQEDYQPVNPEIERPDKPCGKRKMEMNRYGMFYIESNFYVDKRWGLSQEHDYSVEVRRWMKERGIKEGKVEKMETSALKNIPIRLGYPYLYMHQGKCEHLVLFTDARLARRTDLLLIEDYPLLLSFAILKGRYCILCESRLAKLLVVDCPDVPYDNAFVCNLCSYSYLYDSMGKKKSDFKIYKYIDRSAIL